MLLQSTSAIHPGANNRGPNPALDWIGAGLVYGDVTPTGYFSGPADEHVFIGHKLQNGEPAAATYGPFRQLSARSLSNAVEASSLLSAANPLRDGGYESVGVMQAADGTYFATGLSERYRSDDGGTTPAPIQLSIDGMQKSVQLNDIQQLHPDLRAVVGTTAWVNFTNETIDPKLAG